MSLLFFIQAPDLLPIFRKLVRRRIRVIIDTKPHEEQDIDYSQQAEECIAILQSLGVEGIHY